MYLNEALHANAKQSMEEFIDDLGDNEDCMDKFSEWEDEFTSGGTRWWDFNESELTIANINTLLLYSAKYVEECSVDQPEDVYDLLKRYGEWTIRYEEQRRFYIVWEDAWNEKFPENNEENNE